MEILGRDLLISMSDDKNNLVPVCHSKSCTLSRDRDMLVITDPFGPDERYIPARKRGTVAAEGLMIYTDTVNGISVLDWLEDGKLVFFSFTTSLNGGLILSGQMYIDHWEETGEYSGVLTYSFTGKIHGKLNREKQNTLKTIYLADTYGTRLPECPNAYPVRVYWYDGTALGIAYDQADVIGLYSSYAGNTELLLTGFTSGCDFTLSAAWSASFIPDWIVAEALNDDLAISDAQINIIGDGDGDGLAPIENT